MTMRVLTRRDSRGQLHRVTIVNEDGFDADLHGALTKDSVQVTCCGKFKIGDMVRPTKRFVEEVMGGRIPYESVAQWNKGFKIIEIGPEGYPWAGSHDIDLEGLNVIGLTPEYIEKVSP